MAFEKDLGYLDKFFDNIEEHAASLDDTSGARLVSLIGEERVRWGEIRSLLAGGAAPAPEKAEETTATEGEGPGSGAELDVGVSAKAAAPASTAEPVRATFTVGSLRGG